MSFIDTLGGLRNLSPGPDIAFQLQDNGQPWPSVLAAHQGTPTDYRAIGKIRWIDLNDGKGMIEYWYKGGTSIENLVPRYENLESAQSYVDALNAIKGDTLIIQEQAEEYALQAKDYRDMSAGPFKWDGRTWDGATGLPNLSTLGLGNTDTDKNKVWYVTEPGSNSYTGETESYEPGDFIGWSGTSFVKLPKGDLALQKTSTLEQLADKGKYLWRDKNVVFSNNVNGKEIEVAKSIRDVVIYSEYGDIVYALNYIKRGDATNPTVISLDKNLSGVSFPTSFGNGVVSGIQIYKCVNPDNGDEIVITIDWTLITTTNVNFFVTNSKAVFASSCYIVFPKKGNAYIFENPLNQFSLNEKKILGGILNAAVRNTNPGLPTIYGINYITKGSTVVETRISLTIDKGGTSFPISFGLGIPAGVVEYKLVNPTNFDEIYLTLDWSKITSTAGEQIFVTANKATFHKNVYSTLQFLQRDVFEDPSAAFNYAEIETALALRSVWVQSVNPGVFYSLYYLQKGDAVSPTIIAVFNNSTASSFNLTLANGIVKGVKKYTLTATNQDKINLVIDWDRMTTAGTASKYFLDVARSLFNKANYLYTEWIERKVFEDPSAAFNSAEIETILALRDISIQSKNYGVFYSLYYIQKGDADNPTIISFYNNTTLASFNKSFGNGIPAGVKKYVIDTSPNGDVIQLVIDWSKMTVAGLASKVFQNVGRSLINKSRYKDLFSIGQAAPAFITPLYVPYALGREFPIWKENVRKISYANEPDTRLDISANDGTRTYICPDSSHLKGFKYLRQTTESVPAPFNITLTNKLHSGETLNAASFPLRCVSNVYNPTADLYMCIVGDSHMKEREGLVTRELKRLFDSNGSFKPHFIGTVSSTGDGVTVLNEGRPSWDTRMFTTTGSPFFIGGQLSFSAYMALHAFPACDIMPIHLGNNDEFRFTKEEYIANLKLLMASAWEYNPNMLVILSMPTMGALDSSDGNFIKTTLIPFLELLKTEFANYKSPNNVQVVLSPTYLVANRATDWGFRFPEQRDGQVYPYDKMHLNDPGYLRIADILFSSIMYGLNWIS
ncbi:hypothetical protein LZD49_12410 [Dyadobacter sp. CY261]|uniref:hypothetical protein n=1 Tax=Dyadobacter sp. CY261 TaxID=2907203 RepID=UPI001F168D04|nr:hypothetical protein [Dyadobacter sp. CY261]MCF0071275.1 hypothetical protein [Dyadobacter sp. CY261]